MLTSSFCGTKEQENGQILRSNETLISNKLVPFIMLDIFTWVTFKILLKNTKYIISLYRLYLEHYSMPSGPHDLLRSLSPT